MAGFKRRTPTGSLSLNDGKAAAIGNSSFLFGIAVSREWHRYANDAFAWANGIIGDGLGTEVETSYLTNIRAGCNLYRHVQHLSDEEICKLIRADGVDILVD
ncbi:MAG: hypothetical protein HOI95_04730 [Chromatiales bacterium]|nr:hypothetical protein [Chromatiales bacterium]